MSMFFIDHVTTYRKHCKSGKGAELAVLLSKFEHMLMSDSAFSDFVLYLEQKISALNASYPKSKPFCIKKNGGSLYIRPEDSVKPTSFESDYAAVVSVKRVKQIPSSYDLQEIFRQFNDSVAKKGGDK